jgi:hypothetical protein
MLLMSQRDDFSSEVKRQLGSRAGHRCSAPNCRAPTNGPSQSRRSGASSVGVAAHIASASPGGPRYDPTQTPEQRQAIENGVWLCQNDAKRIDDDEERYTRQLLVQWRLAAERAAQDELGRPHGEPRNAHYPWIFDLRTISNTPQLHDRIHGFLLDIGASVTWGRHYDLLRMTIYEIAINAMEHGNAPCVKLTSGPGMVMISDEGSAFGLDELRAGGRGGHQALLDLEEHAGRRFSVRYRRDGDKNDWSIIDESSSGGIEAPCSLVLDVPRDELYRHIRVKIRPLVTCSEIHVYGGFLWSYSDWARALETIRASVKATTIVVHGLPYDSHVANMMRERFDPVVIVE